MALALAAGAVPGAAQIPQPGPGLAAQPAVARPAGSLCERLGENWRWRTIDGPGGISRFSEVRAWRNGGLIAVDDRGLLAFDGYEWKREPGWENFSYQRVRDLLPQDDGLIAVTSQAIVTISASGTLRTLMQVDSPLRVTRVCHLPDGSALVGVEDRIVRIAHDGVHEAFPAPEGSKMLAGLVREKDGTLWVCTDTGIHRRDHGSDTWQRVSGPPADEQRSRWISNAFAVGNRVQFLPSVIDDIARGFLWDGQQMSALYDGHKPAAITSAIMTPDDELVVAVREPRLAVFHDGTWSDVKLPPEHPDFVQSMCLTPDGRLAVVFASGDLAVCDLRSTCWEQHDPTPVGASPVINAIAVASAGGVWIGTQNGVARWDGARFTDAFTEFPDHSAQLFQVTSVCEDDRGRLWVGSGSGFTGGACLDHGRWTLHDGDGNGVGPHFVHAIRRDGDDLWFLLLGDAATSWQSGGLVRLRGDTFTTFLKDADGKPLPRCYDLLRLADGALVVGALGGLLVLDGEAFRPLENGPPVETPHAIFALTQLADGELIAGLGLDDPGVFRKTGGFWQPIDADDGRRAPAASFARTSDGRQWFASSLGLYLFTPDAFHDVSGLLPARTMWPLLADDDKGLWIGMLGGGLAHFRPTDVQAPRTLSLDVRPSDEGNYVARWSGADAWNCTRPESLRFRVRLDDADVVRPIPEAWTAMRSHELSLGRLSPGSHRLSVTAEDSLGNVEEHPPTHDFTVPHGPPSILHSGAVLGSLAVGVFAAGWLAFNLLNRRRERQLAHARQSELTERLTVLTRRLMSTQEDERRSLSRELHDNLGQICTALCIDIQRAAKQDDPPRRTETLDHALGVARELLDRVRQMSFELRPLLLDDHGLQDAVSVALADFTALTGVDVQAELQFAGPEAPGEVAGHVYRILQEALTNVTRHAGAQTVDVRLRTSDRSIDLTVSDDGRGFEPEALPLQRRFGLLGMRERAELIGGTFKLQSSPHGGTTIHVSIPLKRSGMEGSSAQHPGNDSHG